MSLFKEAYDHAYSEFPNESCGLLLHSGEYIACENLADAPSESFRINPRVFAEFRNRVAAIVHSHPDGSHPSDTDRKCQKEVLIPYVVLSISGDFTIAEYWIK